MHFGAGYIGSHTCVELLNDGFEIVVLDNFSNSNMKSIENIKKVIDRIFGIHMYHIATIVDTNIESIKNTVLDVVEKEVFKTSSKFV